MLHGHRREAAPAATLPRAQGSVLYWRELQPPVPSRVECIHHLAVNSWREGVPAICIGMGAETRAGTLSDKKKELFYAACGARPFYVFIERLRGENWPAAEAGRLAQLLARPDLAQAVTGRLRSHARAVEAELAAALKSLMRSRLTFPRFARR
jgi:hypothetical protein